MPSPRNGRSAREPLRHAPLSVVEREALDYLGAEIQPVLRRGEHPTLARAVLTAVKDGSVKELARLSERQRRELLETIETRLHRGRPAPTPRALVHLTTAIACLPELPLGALAPGALPAR